LLTKEINFTKNMRYFAVAVIAGIGAVNAQKSNFAKLF